MTPEQEQQFKRFGCVPRCLIELAKRSNRPVSRDEFCGRFESYFVDPAEKYGALDPDYVPVIANSLSIPSAYDSRLPVNRLADVVEYEEVIKLNKVGVQLMVGSKINLDDGAADESGHCSILEKIDESTFTLWTPARNGDYTLSFPRKFWKEKKCYGIFFTN